MKQVLRLFAPCSDECAELNEHFFTYIQTGKPFVTLKSAMSLDGKIATFTGQSQWITNESPVEMDIYCVLRMMPCSLELVQFWQIIHS